MEGSWGQTFNFSRALRLAPSRLVPPHLHEVGVKEGPCM